MSKPVQSSNVTIPSGQAASVNTASAQTTKASGLAIASFVCGIISVFFFGITVGTIAIIFGSIALRKIAEKPLELHGEWQAATGIVCGIIGIAIWIYLIVYFF